MPLFFRITGGFLLAVFLYLSISLQCVDVSESCSSELLTADRIWLLWYSLGGLLFFAGSIALPRWSSLLLFLAGFMLIHPAIILYFSICGHESYGLYPLYWLGCLIVWFIMSTIHLGIRNIA
ncbi:MAG: hypothetical protein UHH87_01875 [Akkermansia sp.]|nr:hypothetical protein [Akkermansia sp.]